jgi:hypothetical protein
VPQGLRPGSRMAAGVNCAWRWPVNLTESRSWSTAGLPMSRRLYGGWIADADKKAWRGAGGHRAGWSVLSAGCLRRALAGGSGWPAMRLSRARIVVSEVSRCSRSDSARVLIAWVMTAWMAGNC